MSRNLEPSIPKVEPQVLHHKLNIEVRIIALGSNLFVFKELGLHLWRAPVPFRSGVPVGGGGEGGGVSLFGGFRV